MEERERESIQHARSPQPVLAGIDVTGGRRGRDRTADPLGVNQVLYQLSYAPLD
jgi:hypothetical protein